MGHAAPDSNFASGEGATTIDSGRLASELEARTKNSTVYDGDTAGRGVDGVVGAVQQVVARTADQRATDAISAIEGGGGAQKTPDVGSAILDAVRNGGNSSQARTPTGTAIRSA